MPGSAKRSVAAGGQGGRQAGRGNRRSGARPVGTGRKAAAPRRLAHRISWSRRVGIALALLLLVGASIAFASQALDGGPSGRGDSARPTGPRPPAPTLIAPAEAITRLATIDLAGTLPAGLLGGEAYRLRVYVNNRLVRDRNLPAETAFALTGVPLEQGSNEMHATIVGAGGEGPPSASVSIVRDNVAPVIRISRPAPDSTVYGEVEALRGRTEAGSSLTIVDEATDEELPTSVQPDGRFEATLHLAVGENSLLLRSQDPAGNVARTRLVVVRAASLASISLTVAPTDLALADMPSRVEVAVVVHDELGQPADGADITFSLSPPNRATTTYRTTAAGGLANWPDLVLADDGRAAGTWLVTVRAVLPSGMELREDESVVVR